MSTTIRKVSISYCFISTTTTCNQLFETVYLISTMFRVAKIAAPLQNISTPFIFCVCENFSAICEQSFSKPSIPSKGTAKRSITIS